MHTDIQKNGWVQKLPCAVRPYFILARLDRLIGIVLLLLPCLWGLTLADGIDHGCFFYILFFIGAVVMRSAGCVINDLADHKLDQHVERTQGRPLASGELPKSRAVAFLIGLLFIGLFVLLNLNTLSIILGIACMPFVIAYPFMKRFTWYPQVFLGFVFNVGALIGWAAVQNSLSLVPFFLYVSAIFWTLAYDTVYAYQDAEDDVLIGIKSTALKFADQGREMVYASITLQFVFLWMAFLFDGFALGSVLITIPAIAYSFYITCLWDMRDHESCLKTFKAFSYSGWLIFAAILLIQL